MNTHEKDADPDAAVASAAYWTLKNLNTYLGTLTPAGSLPLQTSGNDWEAWFAASLATIPDGAAKEPVLLWVRKLLMQLCKTGPMTISQAR